MFFFAFFLALGYVRVFAVPWLGGEGEKGEGGEGDEGAGEEGQQSGIYDAGG